MTQIRVSERHGGAHRLLAARKALVNARANLSRCARALCRSVGKPLPTGSPEGVAQRLLEEGTDPEVALAVLPMAESMAAISGQVDELEAEIRKEMQPHAAHLKILKSIPGVGDMVSTAFLTLIEDVHRFRSASQVSAYVGLVPWVQESAGKRKDGSITRHGNQLMRDHAVQAAHAFLAAKEDSALKQWFEESQVEAEGAEGWSRLRWKDLDVNHGPSRSRNPPPPRSDPSAGGRSGVRPAGRWSATPRAGSGDTSSLLSTKGARCAPFPSPRVWAR